MADITRVNGLIKSCMELATIDGKMAKSIEASIRMTRNMDLDSTLFRTGEHMKVGGVMGSNTGLAFLTSKV